MTNQEARNKYADAIESAMEEKTIIKISADAAKEIVKALRQPDDDEKGTYLVKKGCKNTDLDFQEWLQKELRKRNWRQKELVEKTGLARATVSLLYLGKNMPNLYTFLRILDVFGLRVELKNAYRE